MCKIVVGLVFWSTAHTSFYPVDTWCLLLVPVAIVTMEHTTFVYYSYGQFDFKSGSSIEQCLFV